jgi:Bromodomain
LKGVQKRVRGIHGRNPPTGITDFHSWDSFEQEMSFIWRNAREYNEDGSEIFELAGELEVSGR